MVQKGLNYFRRIEIIPNSLDSWPSNKNGIFQERFAVRGVQLEACVLLVQTSRERKRHDFKQTF